MQTDHDVQSVSQVHDDQLGESQALALPLIETKETSADKAAIKDPEHSDKLINSGETEEQGRSVQQKDSD